MNWLNVKKNSASFKVQYEVIHVIQDITQIIFLDAMLS